MKKQILSFLLICSLLLFSSCTEVGDANKYSPNTSLKVIEVDSCEYVLYTTFNGASIVHKQNCKYCAKRNNP